MNTQKIYEKYQIPPNLQKHMLRVAAFSAIITKKFIQCKIDEKTVVLTSLFHDLANIIKFNFERPLLFADEENQVVHWKNVQFQIKQKYGNDVHLATCKIAEEIGLPNKVISLIKKLDWANTLSVVEKKEYESAITIYADMRIGPNGILPLEDRINNLASRSKSNDFNTIMSMAKNLEKFLQERVVVDLNSISNTEIEGDFPRLLKLHI